MTNTLCIEHYISALQAANQAFFDGRPSPYTPANPFGHELIALRDTTTRCDDCTTQVR